MVAAEHLVMYGCCGHTVHQSLRYDEVIDAPSDVLLACLESVRPPRIGRIVGVKRSERIDKSLRKKPCHLRTLLVRESGVLAIGLRILQVNLLVRHIKVATENDWLAGVKRLDVRKEVVLPCHAVVQTAQTVLRVGRIARYEEEIVHLQRDDTALMVVFVLLFSYAIADRQRLETRVDGSS